MTAAADLADLYPDYLPAARAYAARLAPAGDRDDLVAESFTRVAAAMNRGRTPAAFGPYLAATMRNVDADTGRQRARLIPVPDPEPPAAPPADAAVLAADEAARVRRAFESLPDRWRRVLWATEVDQVRPARLAAEFGTTADGVSALSARAREALRQAYLAEHAGRIPAACRVYTQMMAAGTRGRLGPRRQARLDEHLACCGRCRRLSAEMAQVNSRLRVAFLPVLGAVAAAGRRMRWHPLAWLAAAAVASAGVAVPYQVSTRPPAPNAAVHQVVPQVIVTPAAGSHHKRAYTGRHAKPPGGPGPAVGSPASAAAQAAAVPAAAAAQAGSAARGVLPAAVGQVTGVVSRTVTTAGQTAGAAVASTTATAGQAAGAVSPAAGQAVTQLGSQAGGTVSGLTGTAGQAVAGLGGVLGGQ
jgi:RNA polymerase sigma factor (sigma-70 family)